MRVWKKSFLIQERAQLVHNMKLSKGPLGPNCHLLLEEPPDYELGLSSKWLNRHGSNLSTHAPINPSFNTFSPAHFSLLVSSLTMLLLYLYMLKHIWMVANLPQLHNSVHKRFCTTFALQEKECQKYRRRQTIYSIPTLPGACFFHTVQTIE